MTGYSRKSMVIFNNTSFGVADSAVVQPINNLHSSDQDELSITCLETDDGNMLVFIASESHWKLLSVPLRQEFKNSHSR